MLTSQLCNQEQMQTAAYREWCRRIKEPPRFHRKQWEFFYIAQALAERGMLAPGRRGIGFGVGREPLASLFASYGCEIVATDLDEGEARVKGWLCSGQFAKGISNLNEQGICDAAAFERLVTFRSLDMNEIPGDLRNFDFAWSSCSLEHVGSIDLALEFIVRSLDCLRPGGVAAHTTEFNLNSNTDTLTTGGTVILRQCDLEDLAGRLRRAGHEISLDLRPGEDPADFYIDVPPYFEAPHLRLQLGSYVCTSVGLIVRKSGGARTQVSTRSALAKSFAAQEPVIPYGITRRPDEHLAVTLTDDTALVLAHGRLPILVDTRDRSLAPHLLLDGYWDLPEAEVFRNALRPGMTVVDVGANYGYFTLIAADVVGPSGRVHSVEPHPGLASLLQKTIEINGFENIVQVHRCAALDAAREELLYCHPNLFGSHTLSSSGWGNVEPSKMTVAAKPLDEIIPERVHVMKIDAQGSEPWILRGMSQLLARSPGIQILMELAPACIRAAGADPAEFLRELRKTGLRWRAVTDQASLEDCEDDRLVAGGVHNLYMTLE